MTKRRYLPEEIISKLREAEVLFSQGKTAAEAASHVIWVDYAFQILTAVKAGARMECAVSLTHALTMYLMEQKQKPRMMMRKNRNMRLKKKRQSIRKDLTFYLLTWKRAGVNQNDYKKQQEKRWNIGK